MREFTDPGTLSAELAGVSCLVAALWQPFADDKVSLTNETIADCLFAIELHLERIIDSLDECQRREEEPA